jgi:hypothetical protein
MRKLAALAALCLAAAHSHAQDKTARDDRQPGKLTLGGGLHYSQGDYGTNETTKITTLAFTGRYDLDPWTFRVTLPFLYVSGGDSVVPGIGAVGRSRGADSASGVGDLTGSATYNALYDAATQLGIDLTAKVKLGTADRAEGLGTGEHDFSFGAELYKTIERMTVFGALGYTVFGDPPGFRLHNGFYYSVGASWKLPPRESIGLSLDGRQEIAPGTGPQRELVGFWSRNLEAAWKLQAYFLVGLADASPDWGGGVTLARPF